MTPTRTGTPRQAASATTLATAGNWPWCWIYAQFGYTSRQRGQGQIVIKVNIGYQGTGLSLIFSTAPGHCLRQAPLPEPAGTRPRRTLDLLQRTLDIAGIGIGHGLNCYWIFTAQGHVADPNGPGHSAFAWPGPHRMKRIISRYNDQHQGEIRRAKPTRWTSYPLCGGPEAACITSSTPKKTSLLPSRAGMGNKLNKPRLTLIKAAR